MVSLVDTLVVFFGVLCAYGAFKLHQLYKRYDDLRYIVFLSILLLVFADVWISFYGVTISAFFKQYRFLLTAIPLAIYGWYAYSDYKHRKEKEEKQKIKKAFSTYVMPAIVDEMLKDPAKLKLGGEKRHLAIFFSDVRGFTTISEKLSPEQLTSLLNEYLDEMTEIILDNQGTVDKYIGDAIMAFWGAPIKHPDNIRLSVKTAVEQMNRLDVLRKDWKKRGLPDIDIGIGINCGDVVVGNMGSHKRFDYSCLGDHVNLAARLEGITKVYGSRIVVSDHVHKVVAKDYETRFLDLVAVKGKKEPIAIFQIFEDKADKKFLAAYEKALALYKKRKWADALKEFKKAIKIWPDKTCDIYIERAETFMKKPPTKDWDGVYRLTTK